MFRFSPFGWLVPGVMQTRPADWRAPRGARSLLAGRPSWAENLIFSAGRRAGDPRSKSRRPHSSAKQFQYEGLAQRVAVMGSIAGLEGHSGGL